MGGSGEVTMTGGAQVGRFKQEEGGEALPGSGHNFVNFKTNNET